MINGIVLRFGRIPGADSERISTTPVTVFVGPNNSGKSQVLREIHRYCSSGQRDVGDVIVQRIEFQPFTADTASEQIQRVTLPRRQGEMLDPDNVIIGKRGARNHVPLSRLLAAMQDPNGQARHFCPWYLAFNTLMLDGRSRIDLVKQQNAGDLISDPQSSFQVLFQDSQLRTDVRRIIYDAFKLFFVIDPTNLGHLRLRLSSRDPASELEECGIHAEARRFHAAALPVEQASDGVRGMTGSCVRG